MVSDSVSTALLLAVHMQPVTSSTCNSFRLSLKKSESETVAQYNQLYCTKSMLLSRSSVACWHYQNSALDEGTMKNSALQLTNQILNSYTLKWHLAWWSRHRL